jgi:hypothetical protein
MQRHAILAVPQAAFDHQRVFIVLVDQVAPGWLRRSADLFGRKTIGRARLVRFAVDENYKNLVLYLRNV